MNPTQRVALGHTGLSVTRLGLGTGPMGGLYAPVRRDDALAVVEASYDAGIRLFDTAPFYGYGQAEERLGAVLEGRPRDEFVLSTKVGRLLRPRVDADDVDDMWRFERAPSMHPVFDFSGDGVLRSVEESLLRLKIDRIDVLYIHDPYEHMDQALRDAYPALASLREQGVVRAIGVGMGQSDALLRFARECDFDCFLLAGQYTLLDQTALSELLPHCERHGVAVVMGSVFHGGLLAGPQPGHVFDEVPPAVRVRLERLRTVCAGHGISGTAAALQFPLGHPAVASVLTGVRSRAELEENLAAFQQPIPADFWTLLRDQGLVPEDAPLPAD